jgi:predicted permease
MRDAAAAPIAWSVFLAVLAAMLWVWSPGDELAIALLGGAALGAALVALAVALRATPRDERSWRVIPDLSPATSLLAIGLATMLIGLEAGQWLIWIGAGLFGFALFGLARELRLERRRR